MKGVRSTYASSTKVGGWAWLCQYLGYMTPMAFSNSIHHDETSLPLVHCVKADSVFRRDINQLN